MDKENDERKLSKSNSIKIIGIIPCKEHSERLPNKNILLFGNKELYIHSIQYALDNNITPIVSTDSEYIIDYCKSNNIQYYRETINDSNMCNCIDQVLSKYECDYFILLQPTSPIRIPKLIEKLKYPKTSIYTCDKIKIIGHIDTTFKVSYRDQDESTKFLYHFDGNLIFVNTKWYKENHCLFNNESEYFIEDIPYSLQIDNEQQFKILESIYVNCIMPS